MGPNQDLRGQAESAAPESGVQKGAGPTEMGGPCSTGLQSHHPRGCGWVGMCPQTEAVTADTTLCPTLSQVSYMPDRGKLEMFALRDVPSPLGAKLAVLRLFAGYMQQRLREVRAGGQGAGGVSRTSRWRGLRPLCLGLSSGRGPAYAQPGCQPGPLPAALSCIPAGPAAALQ